jgi:hypothetical protein
MTYHPYEGIPPDLHPTFADAVLLTEIADDVKEAARVRHDFHTAIHVSDTFASIRQAFIPAIVSPPQPPAERHLRAAPPWESFFAQSFRAEGKTLAGLAGEHARLALEAKTYAARIQGNAKLAQLIRNNLNALFPDIGYSAASGDALRRLRKDEKSVLLIFQPLGVDDAANVIRLLLKRPPGMYYYW